MKTIAKSWRSLPLNLVCAVIILISGRITGLSKPPRAAKPEIKITVELWDGSRLVGRPLTEQLEFESPVLGQFKVRLAQLQKVEWLPKKEEARINTVNRDEFQAKLTMSEFRLMTALGAVKVPLKSLRSIQVWSSTPADLRKGLVALWSGENNAQDSAEGHDGTMLHGAGFARGKVGQAFYFASDQGRVYVPDAQDFILKGSFSIACWINASEFTDHCICARGDDRSGLDTWSISAARGDRIAFGIATPENIGIFMTAPAKKNEWFHLACAYDSDASELRMYIDGRLVADKKITGSPIWELDAGMDPSICIGNAPGKWHRFPFRGLVDEFAMFGRALTEADAQALTRMGNSGQKILPEPPQEGKSGRF